MPKTQTAGAKTVRHRSRPPQFATFLIQFDDWQVSYSLAAGEDHRFTHNGLGEYQHLDVRGAVLSPKRFAGRPLELKLLGTRDFDARLDGPERGGFMALVGTLTLRGQRNEFLGSMPASALWGLLPALAQRKGPIYVLDPTGRSAYLSVRHRGTAPCFRSSTACLISSRRSRTSSPASII